MSQFIVEHFNVVFIEYLRKERDLRPGSFTVGFINFPFRISKVLGVSIPLNENIKTKKVSKDNFTSLTNYYNYLE